MSNKANVNIYMPQFHVNGPYVLTVLKTFAMRE